MLSCTRSLATLAKHIETLGLSGRHFALIFCIIPTFYRVISKEYPNNTDVKPFESFSWAMRSRIKSSWLVAGFKDCVQHVHSADSQQLVGPLVEPSAWRGLVAGETWGQSISTDGTERPCRTTCSVRFCQLWRIRRIFLWWRNSSIGAKKTESPTQTTLKKTVLKNDIAGVVLLLCHCFLMFVHGDASWWCIVLTLTRRWSNHKIYVKWMDRFFTYLVKLAWFHFGACLCCVLELLAICRNMRKS